MFSALILPFFHINKLQSYIFGNLSRVLCMFNRTYTYTHHVYLIQLECSLHSPLLSRSSHSFEPNQDSHFPTCQWKPVQAPWIFPCKWLLLTISSSAPLPSATPKVWWVTIRHSLVWFRSWFGAFIFPFTHTVTQKTPWIFLCRTSPFLYSSSLATAEGFISPLLWLLVTLTSHRHHRHWFQVQSWPCHFPA